MGACCGKPANTVAADGPQNFQFGSGTAQSLSTGLSTDPIIADPSSFAQVICHIYDVDDSPIVTLEAFIQLYLWFVSWARQYGHI